MSCLSSTPVVLMLNEVVLVLDHIRETLPASRSTSTGETTEYEHDQKYRKILHFFIRTGDVQPGKDLTHPDGTYQSYFDERDRCDEVTFSHPLDSRSQLRRVAPVSHRWANARSSRSLRRRRPRLPLVLRRFLRSEASRGGDLFVPVRFCFGQGSGLWVRP